MSDEQQPGTHLEAHASDDAQVIQAGRDVHIIHGLDGPSARRAAGVEIVEDCPYPGLAAFTADDAAWFFGRDALLAELAGLLASQPSGPVLLVASSGAGKSSLLQAGLIPAIDRGVLPQPGSIRWPRLLFSPTAHPLAALSEQLTAVTGTPTEQIAAALRQDPDSALGLVRAIIGEHRGLLMVIDQFEETFTLCEDPAERAAFIDAVCTMSESGCLTVLSVRADFYQEAAIYPRLRAALRDSQVLMGPMSETELRQAIVFPSQVVGLELERGLVELLIRDLGGATGAAGGTSYDTGRLPLLAHALRATWQHRHGHVLTVDGYLATGGIGHAIATSADRTYGQLTEIGQKIARLVFLRLTKIGDHTDDTRRMVTYAAVVQDEATAAVIEAFTRARLLTRERDTVEITHEALLREWPRLRGWIDTDHATRLLQQDLEDQAAAWERAGGDTSRLYRGAQLAAARTWAMQDELTSRAREFLKTSLRANRRSQQLRRGALAVFAVLTLAAGTLVGVAVSQEQDASRSQHEAVFNEISEEAQNLRVVNPSLAAQLTVAAYRLDPTSTATYTSLISTQEQGLATTLTLGTTSFTVLRYSPNGHLLAAAGGRVIRLWNDANQQDPAPLGGQLPGVSANVKDIDFSPDSDLLVAGLANGTVEMWNLADPMRPVKLPTIQVPTAHGKSVWPNFYSQDVLIAFVGGALQFWSIAQLSKPVLLSSITTCDVEFWMQAPRGHELAFGCTDGKAYLADTANPRHPRIQASLAASPDGSAITTVRFSPNGRLLFTSAFGDGTFILWNVSDPSHPRRAAATNEEEGISEQTNLNDGVNWAAFSPDDSLIATADQDGTIQLWDAADPYGDPFGQQMNADSGPALQDEFSPNGEMIASGYADGTIRLWSIPHLFPTFTVNNTATLSFNSAGTLLAASSNESSSLQLWSVTDQVNAHLVSSATVCPGANLQQVAFDPKQSDVLAIGCSPGGYFRLWNTANPAHITALSPPMKVGGKTTSANNVSFDAGGKLLAVSDSGGEVTLWNVADPARPAHLGSVSTGQPGYWASAALSPDGRTLAASANETTHLWNVSDPAKPKRVGTAPHGPTQSVTALAFSPNGTLVAGASQDHNIYLWYATGPHAGALATSPLAGHTDFVSGVDFSPDSQTLASSSDDDTLRLWNVTSPGSAVPLGEPLIGHTDHVLGLAFSPDGHVLASIGFDDTLLLWDLNASYAIDRICADTVGGLTPTEWSQDLPGVPYDPPCPGR